MTETQKYLDCLKEIKTFSKDLDKDIVVAIINQVGIDSRLNLQSNDLTKREAETKEPVKTFIPATEGQVKALKLMKKFKEGMSKQEAWKIINESNKKNNEEEY